MFKQGTSWRKKVFGAAVMYVVFFALGLLYASRIFHIHHLVTDAGILLLLVVGSAVIWFNYKKKTDRGFAARIAERKATASRKDKPTSNQGAISVLLFHLLFFISVFAFKSVLERFGSFEREHEIIFATAGATALAGLVVMTLVGYQDRKNNLSSPKSNRGGLI